MVRCQFCLDDVENEDTREVLDGETLVSVCVCESCAEEVEAVDNVIDCQIEDNKLLQQEIPI